MILFIKIRDDQKKALLSLYPDIKVFVEKTISDTADKIIIDQDNFNVEKELAAYHDRRVLNGEKCNRRRKCNQATKDKISQSLKGKYTGWHQFPETIEKIRLANIGKHSGPNLKSRGKKRTEEQRINIGLGHMGMKYKKRVK